MADELRQNALTMANTLTSKAGPRRGRQGNTQETQSTNTMQKESQEPPTPVTVTRKQLFSSIGASQQDRNSVGYGTLHRAMLENELSPSPARVNTRRAHQDSLDSIGDRDQYKTPSPTGRAHRDSLDSDESIRTGYGHQQTTESRRGTIPEADLPSSNPAVANHPTKRRITIDTVLMGDDEIAEAIRATTTASLPTDGELVNEDRVTLAEEEMQKLINTHPGFRIQIWGDGWESVASTPQELTDKVKTEPLQWFHGIAQLQQASVLRESRINKLLLQLKDSQDAYNEEHSEVAQLHQKIKEQDAEFDDLDKAMRASMNDNDRLRKIRTNDRQTIAQVTARLHQLEEELLRANHSRQGYVNPEDFNRDTTRLGTPKVLQTRHRLINLPEVQQRVSMGNQGPVFSNNLDEGVKNSYPIPKTFTGDDDDVSYDWWKGEIATYLNHNTRTFITEWKCIELIRGRTGGLAFALIKARAAIDSNNKYTEIEELFADLDAEFKPCDEEISAQTKITAESTKIQPAENFNKFIARFNVIMGPLLYNRDSQKITWLLNALLPNAELYRVALTSQKGHTYQTLVTFLRDICSRDLGEHYVIPATKYRTREAKSKSKKELNRVKQGKAKEKESRPTLLFRQLIKEKRCLDCGKTGH
jgi:hypothetical protein